ncbi:HAD family hydrolase [bacterium]|nr:HAD family hydrolase [bacterium]
MRLAGVIFDMDGTLVDSGLDFDLIRREMGLGKGPILETLLTLPPDRRRECDAILDRHESAGAERAILLAGAQEWIKRLDQHRIPRAIFTRNARQITERTLARCGIEFSLIISREDAAAKPDPAGIHLCCQRWNAEPGRVLMIGDYLYDIEAGRRAQSQTALVTHGRSWEFAGLADYCWRDLVDGLRDLDKMMSQDGGM